MVPSGTGYGVPVHHWGVSAMTKRLIPVLLVVGALVLGACSSRSTSNQNGRFHDHGT